ncbi:DUF6262 family protein [Paeniglutamicibacter gangotriensis]|uniref:DUF6262 family protein n=1 Tax=Paeniglutamicibacter gangotriensis TaxID=254787 RepID=UPI001CB74F5B
MNEPTIRPSNALQAANEARSRRASEAVISALRTMVRDGDRVNPNAVAKKSGVSRSFIYSQPALRALVANHGNTDPRIRAVSAQERSTDASLRRRLADAFDRAAQLGEELTQVKREREALLGELRELRHSKPRS